MSIADLVKLIFLSAIWGGSFIFLRIAVPEVGPLLTASLRTLFAGMALMTVVKMMNVSMQWRSNLKSFALVGLFACVIPFSCFSYAALHLPVAHSAVLNATAPLFGAVLSIVWLSERLTMRKLIGLLLGIVGVAILVGAGAVALNTSTLLSISACLFGACSYAVSSIVVKKTGRTDANHAEGIHPIAMATGSLVIGGLMMLPAVPFALPAQMPSILAIGCILAMSLLSSALAQALFIPLIVKVGPTRAMCVSFLIPLFGILWAFVFLHEALGESTLLGGIIVLLAMSIVLTAPHPAPVERQA